MERTRTTFRRPHETNTPEQRAGRSPRSTEAETQVDTEHSKQVMEFQGEATPETLKAYLDYLAESGKRFDSALSHYHVLLQAQEQAERGIQTLEQVNKNSQRLAEIKAKAAKLAWALTRYVTSSSIIATGIGAGTYIATGDPHATALATAGGALVGSAVEFQLARAEEINDYSDRWFAQYTQLSDYLAAKKQRDEQRPGTPENRAAQLAELTKQLKFVQAEIAAIEYELDQLGEDPNVTFKDPRPAAVSVEALPKPELLIQQMRTAGEHLNTLLGQYYELATDANSAQNYLNARQAAYDRREAQIELRVTAHKIWEMIKTAHMTLGTAGIVGIAGYMYGASETGMPNPPMAALGAAVGAAIGWFQVSRVEKNIWQHNLPRGQYQARDREAVHGDFQKAVDPQLRGHGEELDQALRLHNELQAQQARLSAELDDFISRYPMIPQVRKE